MITQAYNLAFISDEDLFHHVKGIIQQYRFKIDLKQFNSNIIDPIKLTFDQIIYNKSIAEIINAEIMRQVDKSNNNTIGYFHQNIFKYINSQEWFVPSQGFDIINQQKHIYVEMKNKHNTMNSSSSQKTFLKMLAKVNENPSAICLLVEIIATKSQNIAWEISLDGEKFSTPKIRRVSIDKFYEMVTGDIFAFSKLCAILPRVIKDVVYDIEEDIIESSVHEELKNLSSDSLQGLYLLAFRHYEGFQDFNFD